MCMTEFQVLTSWSKKWISQSRENVKYIKIQAQNINEISDTMKSINYKQQKKNKLRLNAQKIFLQNHK